MQHLQKTGGRGMLWLTSSFRRKLHSMNSLVFMRLRTLFRNGSSLGVSFSIVSALFPLPRGVQGGLPQFLILRSANPQRLCVSALSFPGIAPCCPRSTFSCQPSRSHPSPPLLQSPTHGSPTPRPAFPLRSPLARRNRPRHSRLSAFHRAPPAGRQTLLDRNWLRTWRNDRAPRRRRRPRPRHRTRPNSHRRPPPPRKEIFQSQRNSRRHSRSQPRCHRLRPPHPRLRKFALLHHLADSSTPLHVRGSHRRNSRRHSIRSRGSPRRATGHPRLRLPLCPHAALFAPRIRL